MYSFRFSFAIEGARKENSFSNFGLSFTELSPRIFKNSSLVNFFNKELCLQMLSPQKYMPFEVEQT